MSVSNNNSNTTTTTGKPPPAPPINDARAGLLQQIQAGAKLKAVGMPAADKAPVATNPLNHRDHMMDQIKQGAQLKHVGFFIRLYVMSWFIRIGKVLKKVKNYTKKAEAIILR